MFISKKYDKSMILNNVNLQIFTVFFCAEILPVSVMPVFHGKSFLSTLHLIFDFTMMF